jgi:DNA-binding transcriptional MerR regulator
MHANISKAVTTSERTGRRNGPSPTQQDLTREEQTGARPATDAVTPIAEFNPVDDLKSIGDLAHEFGVTLRTLRFYEAKGLLAPRRDGSRRIYGTDEYKRLTQILTGRRLGFTLSEIKDLIDRPDAAELPLTREQCLAQITLLEQQKRGIEIAIAELRAIYTSFYRRRLEDDGDGSGSSP